MSILSTLKTPSTSKSPPTVISPLDVIVAADTEPAPLPTLTELADKVPFITVLPVTVKLSLIWTLDVECPSWIGTPEVAVPIVIPLDVFELSIFNVVVESREMSTPSTNNLALISNIPADSSQSISVPSTEE